MIEITVKDRTPELFQKLQAAVGRFIRKGIGYLEGEIKSSMAEPKSGRRYGDHIASAPGESPAVKSSNLINSITPFFPSTLEGILGTPVEYGAYLETGTDRMAARPVWEVELNEALPTLESILRQEVRGLNAGVTGSL